MYFEPKNVTLKDGRPCTLRSATVADAQALLDNMKLLSAESDFMLRYPNECTISLEAEQDFLSTQEAAENRLLLVAFGCCGREQGRRLCRDVPLRRF